MTMLVYRTVNELCWAKLRGLGCSLIQHNSCVHLDDKMITKEAQMKKTPLHFYSIKIRFNEPLI